jgi:hypothetical protein
MPTQLGATIVGSSLGIASQKVAQIFAESLPLLKQSPQSLGHRSRPPLTQEGKHANSPPGRVDTFHPARLHNYGLPAALHQHHHLPPLVALVGTPLPKNQQIGHQDRIFGAKNRDRGLPFGRRGR